MSDANDSLVSMLDAWLSEPEDELGSLLRCIRLTLLKHPVAAQAAFAALSAEGQYYAKTPEGERWKKRLAGSELMRRGRDIWEVATLNMLRSGAPELLPSQYIEALSYAASLLDLESRLARASEPVVRDEELET